ncbi:putative membrane protein C6F6,13c [Schizosaccharomyces pombe 972h-] [Rhizoctonia solani]|uniref:Putative membrane protein C6F6,13c [Schizosaccharomyces pombe 972h-] n=1 Tax=Rhizoctonia solani TaxID=456999 RepID=A0A0K6GAF6_9AGAM|nr:putative membrane protein C6F6,13c [Schizosaccharomyces pombe 972h-] [Rhizoctonia solani]
MSKLQTKQALPDELRFTIAVVCKVAIIHPPDDLRLPPERPDGELGRVVDWWSRVGEVWLRDVCAHFDIDPQILPPEPSIYDAESLTGPISHEDHDKIVSALLIATILPNPKTKEEANKQPSNAKASERVARAFGYTAASRAFLSRTIELLSIPIMVLLEAEKTLGRTLFEELKEAEMKEKSEAARKEQEDGWGGKWGRWAATGGGIILGGVAIGLTGGLAAPALLPLLPFLSASTAPIVLGSLFGVAGGGLAGNRVRKRWGGVERFEFEQIAGGNQDSVTHEKVSYAVYQRKGQGSGENGTPEEHLEGEHVPPSLIATICVPGMALDSEDECLYAYKDALATILARPARDVFVLKHSPDIMLSTGETLNTWIRNKLLTKAGKEVLARTAFNAVLAAVSLPMTIYSTTGLALDNDWIRACDKAKKAGNLLSEVLKEKVQGERPVTMVASSLGALALFKALTLLAESNELKEPLVDSVFLISLPQVVSPREWAKIRKVVGRRIVNVYSSRDFVLASVGRLHEVFSGAGFGGMAGLNAVNVHGVEDVDMSEIVGGHFDINSNMTKILQITNVNK